MDTLTHREIFYSLPDPCNWTHGTSRDEIFNGTGGTGFFIFRDGRDGIKILLSIFRDGRDGIFYFSGRAGRDENYAFEFSGRAGRDKNYSFDLTQ